MGLAVAANIKCPYCLLFHKGAAGMNGATEEEFAETTFLASYTARWSAIIMPSITTTRPLRGNSKQIGEFLKATKKITKRDLLFKNAT